MSEIATAYVQIEPTFNGVQSKIASEMGGAGESGGQSFGSGFAKVLGGAGGAVATAGKVMAGAVAAGGTALAGLGASFVSASGDIASYGDNIDSNGGAVIEFQKSIVLSYIAPEVRFVIISELI